MSYHWIHVLYPWGDQDDEVVAIRELPKDFYGFGMLFMAPVDTSGSLLQGDYKLDILDSEDLRTVPLEKTDRGLRFEGLDFELTGKIYRYVGKFDHPDLEFNLAELYLSPEAHEAFWTRVVVGFNPFEAEGGFPGYREKA